MIVLFKILLLLLYIWVCCCFLESMGYKWISSRKKKTGLGDHSRKNITHENLDCGLPPWCSSLIVQNCEMDHLEVDNGNLIGISKKKRAIINPAQKRDDSSLKMELKLLFIVRLQLKSSSFLYNAPFFINNTFFWYE